jgi:hypothetical protein
MIKLNINNLFINRINKNKIQILKKNFINQTKIKIFMIKIKKFRINVNKNPFLQAKTLLKITILFK